MNKISRKNFVVNATTLGATALVATTPVSKLFATGLKRNKSSKEVKFGIISDIHQDIACDASDRLKTFLDSAGSENVDFVIDLGDFCFAKDENRSFIDIWRSYKGVRYNVIGNHDLDIVDKEDYMKFVDMPSRYYSFDNGCFHFIVLDPNNILLDGDYRSPYGSGRYGNLIDNEQMEWLKRDIEMSDKQIILFSHQSLERDGAVENGETVRTILEQENERVGYTKVVAAFSGHDHTDYQTIIRGIAYIQINSASNQWVGSDYACESRYSKADYQKRPSLKYTAPYEESLYAFVTVDSQQFSMKGKRSNFVSPTPQELNIPRNLHDSPLVSYISDFRYYYRNKVY